MTAISNPADRAPLQVINEVETELNGRGSGIDTQFSGTTYTSCIVRNGKLYCANCGDSRVTLGSINSSDPTKLTAKNLTDDHKPDLPEEKKRIVAKVTSPCSVWRAGRTSTCLVVVM